MLKVFPIDFIRQIFEQTLYKEHLDNVNYFGGKDQVNIFSFYEQLKSQDEVNRFVENYRDLTEQQNKTGLIGNGVIVAPENPTITNLYSSLIVPMSWTCSMRCTLENRDAMLGTLNNLVYKLKGKKVDIAQLDCVDENGNHFTQPFMVGTIGNNDGQPKLKTGDYLGENITQLNVISKINEIKNKGVLFDEYCDYFYCGNANKIRVLAKTNGDEIYMSDPILDDEHDVWKPIEDSEMSYLYSVRVIFESETNDYTDLPMVIIPTSGTVDLDLINNESANVPCDVKLVSYSLDNGHLKFVVDMVLKQQYSEGVIDYVTWADCSFYELNYHIVEDDGTNGDIIFPPEHYGFEKFKVSLSFDAMRCDEPRNLNAKEYCEISFGGSATLVSNGVALGNDLLKVAIKKDKYITANGEQTITSTREYLEPLEMPSGSNANTLTSQLTSNLFKTNSHTDSLALTLQYTFIADMNSDLITQWFDYARYGAYALSTGITPNIIYSIWEIWCSWGNYQKKEIIAKIVESIDIENTESDTLTLSLTMQIQGENN